jgi:DNA-binding transcriptional LysR family regulator
LFERTSRRVSLTEAGHRLLPDARAVLAAVDRFRAAASDLRDDDTLAFAYCHGSERPASRLAQAFREQHPDVSVRPAALTSLRIFNDLRSGRLDAAIVHPPVPEPNRLTSRSFATVAFDHVAIPAGHPLAARDNINVADLDGEPVLLVDRADAPTYHDDTIAYCTAHGAHPRWVHHPAAQVERMLDTVSMNGGIGWLNHWQSELVREGVVVRPLDPVTRFDDFHICWRADDQSPTTAEFVATALGLSND